MDVTLTARVVVPIWLPPAAWLRIRLASLRAILTGKDITDEDAEAFGQWYVSRIRIEVR